MFLDIQEPVVRYQKESLDQIEYQNVVSDFG